MDNFSFFGIKLEQLQNILERVIDVLKINICVVDRDGNSIVTPRRNPYGWELLINNIKDIKSVFKWSGNYMEYVDNQKLHYYALPIGKRPAGYIVVGPVILNKKLEEFKSEEIRVLSNVQLKSILDLTRDMKEFIHSLVKNTLDPFKFILRIALEMSQAQSGSIMVLDEQTNELRIKASYGISEDIVNSTNVKLGDDSIAGFVLEQNEPFILRGKSENNRISHLLNRQEIKQSIILPVSKQQGVSAVINLNQIKTKTSQKRTRELLLNLNQLVEAAVFKMGIDQKKIGKI